RLPRARENPARDSIHRSVPGLESGSEPHRIGHGAAVAQAAIGASERCVMLVGKIWRRMRRVGSVFWFFMLVPCPFAPGQVAGLAASPNPVNLSAAFAGAGVTPSIVSITFNGALVTPISIQSITTTTGQQWLQVFITGASVNVT